MTRFSDQELGVIFAVGGKLPLRMRDTFLLALAAALAGQGFTLDEFTGLAHAVAKQVVADDARARTADVPHTNQGQVRL